MLLGEALVRAERVEVHAVGLERGVVVRVAEGLGTEAQAGILPSVFVGQRGGLVEEAEVGSFDVEAEGRDASLVPREGLEDAAKQELDRAGLGGEPGHAGDVEMRGLRAEQEVAVHIDGRLQTAGCIESDRDAGGALATHVGIHPEGQHDVGIARQPDRAQRDGLERFLGHLPEHRGGEEPDLGPLARLEPGGHRIAVGADDRVHGRDEIGVGEAVGDHAVDYPAALLDPHDGADADGRLPGGPEVELMRGRRLELGGDYSSKRRYGMRHGRNVAGWPPRSSEAAAAGAEVGFDGVNAVEQSVPPVVGGTERRPLGKEPARETVGDLRGAIGRCYLYPDEAVKDIFPFPGPEPEGPFVDGGEAPGFGSIHRRAMARRQPQVSVEVLPFERKRPVVLGDAEQARIGGPARAFGERSVHDEPPLGPLAVALAELKLEGAAGPVERPARNRQVAHRMRGLVGGESHGAKVVGQLARGSEGRRTGDDEQPTLLQDSD